MQENNPVPTPVAPVITPQVVVDQPKNTNFLVILLSVLLILSVLIAGFFAFQTQKLVKELTALKNEDKVVAVATTEPTTEPVATESSEVDPTASLKKYNDVLHKIEFSYPSSYSTQGTNSSYYVMSPLLPPTKGYELRDGELKVELYFNVTKENDSLDKYSSEFKLGSESSVISEEKIKLSGKDAVHYQFQGPSDSDLYLFIHNGFRVQIAKYPIKTTRQAEFDQILSTFKFTS